jgi:hypothetical protein
MGGLRQNAVEGGTRQLHQDRRSWTEFQADPFYPLALSLTDRLSRRDQRARAGTARASACTHVEPRTINRPGILTDTISTSPTIMATSRSTMAAQGCSYVVRS